MLRGGETGVVHGSPMVTKVGRVVEQSSTRSTSWVSRVVDPRASAGVPALPGPVLLCITTVDHEASLRYPL